MRAKKVHMHNVPVWRWVLHTDRLSAGQLKMMLADQQSR